MRKIILSMLVLAGATTYAQVGINEENPKATLEIKAKSLSTTGDLEGLLIPRVSINKALQMGNNSEIKESTMIYVNDLTDYTTSPADTKVEDITENGFYFWNKTKWVKTAGQNGEEWVYEPTSKQIILKRSGQSTEFTNKVFYDTATGGYFNYENDQLDYLKTTDRSSDPILFTTKGVKNYHQVNSESVVPTEKYNDKLSANTYGKALGSNTFYLNESTPISTYLNVSSLTSSVVTSTTNASPTHWVVGGGGSVRKQDNQDTKYISGAANGVVILDGNTTGYAIGTRSEVFANSPGNHKDISAIKTYSSLGEASGNVDGLYGMKGSVNFFPNNSSTVKEVAAIDHLINFYSSASPTITDLYGIRYRTVVNNNATVENHYGLYLENVTKAAHNYAIYTNAGDIRFGDLADATPALAGKNRLVITNAEGVLSASDDVLEDFVSLWANDASKTQVVLKNTSDGTTARTDNNRVTISDAGAITAKAFIGYHGASIFPDYVFEKYYNGYSDIKADYNFHNLASVESFIKKNGHLPGYQSAKEIAKEGLIDLSATQLTNVEKIEELYLHTIEQEKAIKAKDAEISALKAELKAQKEAFEARFEKLEKLIK